MWCAPAAALQVFTDECAGLERPERALAAAAAAVALYVLRCATGPLQLSTMQLAHAPLIAAARAAAAKPEAAGGAMADRLADATALLEALVAAREMAARGTELEKLVEMLSGRSGLEMTGEEIEREAARRFSQLEFGTACAIAEYFTAGGICPLAGVAESGYDALELHPAAMHAILHAHEDISAAAAQELPSSVAAARALLRAWLAVQPLLGKHAARGWLLGELDVDGAAALEAAEAVIAAAQEGGASAAVEAAATQALLIDVPLNGIARHIPAVLSALSVDESDWGPVTDEAVVAAVAARMGVVTAELSAEAVGPEADAGAALQDLQDVVAAVDGAGAAAVPCCQHARRAVVDALLELQRLLPAAALSTPVMRQVMALQADLATPERWGAAGGLPEGRELLWARARAALGVAWSGSEPITMVDLASAEAAEASLLALLQGTQSDEQALAVFDVWRDVFEFGAVFGGGPSMRVAGGSLVGSLCKQGRVSDAANVLRLCPDEAVNEAGVERVLQNVADEGRPWHAAAVAAASGYARLRKWAVELLVHGEGGLRPEEVADVGVMGLLLWGLAECGGVEAARVWQNEEVGKMVIGSLHVLPVVGTEPCTEALGLPGLASRLAAEGGVTGEVIAGEAVAEYVDMHPGMRMPEGLVANLARYLAATEARLRMLESQEGQEGGAYMPGRLVRCGGKFGLRDWLREARAVIDVAKQAKF